jgi:hypothetical protein
MWMTTSGACCSRNDVTLFCPGSPIQPKYKTLTRQKRHMRLHQTYIRAFTKTHTSAHPGKHHAIRPDICQCILVYTILVYTNRHMRLRNWHCRIYQQTHTSQEQWHTFRQYAWKTRRVMKLQYRGADNSLARPTSRSFCLMVRIFRLMLVLFYIYITNIPPIIIINGIYGTQNLLSL